MFNRLVRGAVFTKTDAVMRHDEDDALLHKGGEADGRTAVIRKLQEGAAVGNNPAMQRHAVHHRRHAMFAYAIMDIASVVGRCRDGRKIFDLRIVGRSRSAEPPIISGIKGSRVSRTVPDDCRVATFGFSAAIFCFSWPKASVTDSAISPCRTRSNSARFFAGFVTFCPSLTRSFCRVRQRRAMLSKYHPERQRPDGSSPVVNGLRRFLRHPEASRGCPTCLVFSERQNQ